jgi:hypothetical protein
MRCLLADFVRRRRAQELGSGVAGIRVLAEADRADRHSRRARGDKLEDVLCGRDRDRAEAASGRSERMVYFAFDLLYVDGFDLRKAPLIERKRVLAALLEEATSDCFHFAQHLEVAPALVFEQASTAGRSDLGSTALAGSLCCRAREAEALLFVKGRRLLMTVLVFMAYRNSLGRARTRGSIEAGEVLNCASFYGVRKVSVRGEPRNRKGRCYPAP